MMAENAGGSLMGLPKASYTESAPTLPDTFLADHDYFDVIDDLEIASSEDLGATTSTWADFNDIHFEPYSPLPSPPALFDVQQWVGEQLGDVEGGEKEAPEKSNDNNRSTHPNAPTSNEQIVEISPDQQLTPPTQFNKHTHQRIQIQEQLPNLDREGAHMAIVSQHIKLIEIYKEYMWAFRPLHPAIFDETTARYFLSRGDLALDQICPLSVSVNLAAAYGAWLMGNKSLAAEYEARTLTQLVYLNQFPQQQLRDYSMAMASYAFATYSLIYMMSAAESKRYLQLSMDICKSLNALNSDVYSRCLYSMSAHSAASIQNIRLLKAELDHARKVPYFSMLSTGPPIPARLFKYVNGHVNWHALCPLTHRAMFTCCEISRIAANIMGGIRLYKEHLKNTVARGGAAQAASLLMDLAKTVSSFESTSTSIFRRMTEQNDPMPRSIAGFAQMFMLVMKIQCCRMGGDTETAAETATQLLAKMETYFFDGTYPYLCGGTLRFVDMTLEFLLESGNLDGAECLLNLLARVPDVSPLMEGLRATFKRRLDDLYDAQLQRQAFEELSSPCVSQPEIQQQQPPFHMHHHAPQQQPGNYNYNYSQYCYVSADNSNNAFIGTATHTAQGFHVVPGRKRPLISEPATTHRWVSADDEHPGTGARQTGKRRKRSSSPMNAPISQGDTDLALAAYVPSPQTEATHLTLASDCLKYVSEFRRLMWHFFPLHPAVLDESNVSYFLSQEGSQEISSLSLSYYVCLCRGSMTLGHIDVSVECFNRAETQLAYLLESPAAMKDYSIALSVGTLIWQAFYLNIKADKIQYFLNIALDICKALKAFNSDVFIRCNYVLATLPHGLDQIDKMRQSVEKVSQYPYYPVTATTPESFTFYEGSVSGVVKGGAKSFRCLSQLQQRMPVSLRNLTNMTAACGIMANIMSGLNLALDGTPQDEMVTAAMDRTLACVDSFEKHIAGIKEQQTKSGDFWPSTINKHNRFFTPFTRSQCYYRKGDIAQALEYAQRFIEITEKKKMRNVWTSISAAVEMVLRMLNECREDVLMYRLLLSCEKWTQTLPTMVVIKARYAQKLSERMTTSD